MSVEVAGSACFNRDIVIKVTNQKGTYMEGVDIDVVNKNRKVAYGKTDANGTFTYKAKDLGSSTLTAKKQGYKDAVIHVNVSNCVATTVEITTVTTATWLATSSMETTTLPATTTLKAPATTTPTTTTMYACNANGVCERGENYNNCPADCLSGSLDGLCDRKWDGVCDPDCYRKDDNDCLCNGNDVCEPQFENMVNCPADCRPGKRRRMRWHRRRGMRRRLPGRRRRPRLQEDRSFNGGSAAYNNSCIVWGCVCIQHEERDCKHEAERSTEELITDIKRRLRDGEDLKSSKKSCRIRRDTSLLEKAEKTIWE